VFAWVVRASADLTKRLQPSSPRAKKTTPPFEYLTNRLIPREVRRACYERDLAFIHLAALAGADALGRDLDRETIDLLYRGWVSGFRSWFDAIASMYGVTIPDDLRAHANWQRIIDEHERVVAARDAIHERFASGGDQPLLVAPDQD
jgi:hypothetical protein